MSKHEFKRPRKISVMADVNFKRSRKISVMADVNFSKFANDAGEEKDIVPFNGVAYAGGVVRLGWLGKIIVDLASFKAQAKIPMLFHHKDEKIVGHGKVAIQDGKLAVEGLLYNDDDSLDGKSIVSKAKKGFPWKLSIGWIWETRQFLSKGTSAMVNGKKVHGPVTILSGNILDEISFTGTPADRNTKVKVAASADASTIFYMEEENSEQLNNGDLGTMDFTQEEKDALTKELSESKSRVIALEAKLATKDEEISKLSASIDKTKISVREAKLEPLKDSLSEDDMTKLLKVDDDSFDFMVGKLSAGAKLSGDLTNHVANGGEGGEDGGSGEASVDLVAMAKERKKETAGAL